MVTMLDDVALSHFQRICVDELNHLAAARGAAIDRVEASGTTELYVVVELLMGSAPKITAWIYADEGMLTSGERSLYFEKPDFANGKDLRDAFLSAIAALLQGKEPDQKGSSRINLFVGRSL